MPGTAQAAGQAQEVRHAPAARYPQHTALLVTPDQARPANGSTGGTIAAAISAALRRRMPRASIQAATAMLIPAAIASRICHGYKTFTCPWVLNPMTPAKIRPVAIVPTTIAASTGKKSRHTGIRCRWSATSGGPARGGYVCRAGPAGAGAWARARVGAMTGTPSPYVRILCFPSIPHGVYGIRAGRHTTPGPTALLRHPQLHIRHATPKQDPLESFV